jgi:hypothetical protein
MNRREMMGGGWNWLRIVSDEGLELVVLNLLFLLQ